MKFTNITGLPLSLVSALQGDSYDLKDCPKNVISVTTAIAPPKIKTLELNHFDDIVVDVSERLWSVFGSAVHSVLENASKASERLTEERWFINTEDWQVYTLAASLKIQDAWWYSKKTVYLSGKIDCYDHAESELQDYKVCSVYSYLFEKTGKPEWGEQLNMNSFAMRLLGFDIKKLSIICMYRDWSASKAISDYPELPVPMKQIYFPVWSDDYTKDFIASRLTNHLIAREMEEDVIPPCTPEERWAKKTTWAIMKEGRKSAVRVHDTEEQAKIHLGLAGEGHRIDTRLGKDTRCESYCNVNQWCSYWKNKEQI